MKLKVKLVRSPIGNTPRNRRTVEALGLRRVNQIVEHEDSDSIRGMLHSVRHMIEVTPAEGENASA